MDRPYCVVCFNKHGKHIPAFYDDKQKVQYALCLPCQKQTKLGLFKQRVAPVGSDYNEW